MWPDSPTILWKVGFIISRPFSKYELFTFVVNYCHAITFKLYFCKHINVTVEWILLKLYPVIFVLLTLVYFGSETCKGQQNYYHEKDYDDDYLILGLYANHSFA